MTERAIGVHAFAQMYANLLNDMESPAAKKMRRKVMAAWEQMVERYKAQDRHEYKIANATMKLFYEALPKDVSDLHKNLRLKVLWNWRELKRRQ